jgi:NADH-quinone oxidoreductase subunit C
MDKKELTGKLNEKFTNSILNVNDAADMITMTVVPGEIHGFLRFLLDELGFIFLTDLTGIHYPGEELPFGVVYHLHNLTENFRIRIKTFLPKENPVISTVTDLYSGANWMERETFDFFGIVFEGHPDLKRILNVDYMDYFPMRKEYPLEDQTRTDKDDRFFGR